MSGMNEYDKAYRETGHLFGETAEVLLQQHAGLLPQGGQILDIGCGQGRNSIWLARQGHRVTGVDPSAEALNQCRQRAAELPVFLLQEGFLEHKPEEAYAGILSFGLHPDLDRKQIRQLETSVAEWLQPGGFFFVTAFTRLDPAFDDWLRRGREVDHGVIQLENGRRRTFLDADELGKSFTDWAVLHSWEGLGPWHKHGDSEPERHGLAQRVLMKPES